MGKPSAIYRVAITGDFLRFRPAINRVQNSQHRNIAWLSALLKPVLSEIEGVVLSIVMPSDKPSELRKEMANDSVWQEYEDFPDSAWARRYAEHEGDIFPQQLRELAEQNLVIGFELPPSIKRFLGGQGVRYVSFYIHPIRYLRDLCFGATTNCSHISDLLRECQIPASENALQCAKFKALFAGLNLPQTQIPIDAPLLIGQTAMDSSLIVEGKFRRWQDYKSELIDCLGDSDVVCFLEHPYQRFNAENIEFIRSSLRKDVVSIRGNSYAQLFSFPGFSEIITLSSSLGAEAQSMGYDVKFLLADPREKFIDSKVDQQFLFMLGHMVFEPDLWKCVFTKKPLSGNRTSDSFYLGENYLRNSLDSWSYRNIQYGMSIEPMAKCLMPSVAADASKTLKLGAHLIDYAGGNYEPSALTALAIQHGIELQFHEPPLQPGKSWSLPIGKSSTKYYLEQGFHETEHAHVWTGSEKSVLVIPIDFGCTDFRVQLTMDISVFEGALRNFPVLAVYIDGVLKGYSLFRPGMSFPVQMSFDFVAIAPVAKINLEFSNIESPINTGLGNDSRELGFALHHIKATAATSQDRACDEICDESLTVWAGIRDSFTVRKIKTMGDLA